MNFEATVRHAQGVAIVDMSGSLTLGVGADKVRTTLGKLIETGETRILLSCAHVTQVDSAGIGEVMRFHIEAERRGSVLKIAGARDRLANVLKLTGIAQVIECFPDEETALASFGNVRSRDQTESL